MRTPYTVDKSPTLGFRGLIAENDIKKGATICRGPLLFFDAKKEPVMDRTVIAKYYFEYTKKYHCVALGYCSVANHSFTPNAVYIYSYKSKSLIFKALRDIKKGEEIFVNYNGDPNDCEPLEAHMIDGNVHLKV